MSDHVPATLQFSGLSYTASSKQILSSISGSVKPGQIMAIMGASGAGKSTLLDIIAHKAKRGIVSGDIFVNGRKIVSVLCPRKPRLTADRADTSISCVSLVMAKPTSESSVSSTRRTLS